MSVNLGAFLKKVFQPAYHSACEAVEKEADLVISEAITAAKADPSGTTAIATIKADILTAVSKVHLNPLVSAAAYAAISGWTFDASKYTGDAVTKLTAIEADLNYHLDNAHL